MPELPEVETIKKGLEKVLIGKKIKKVELLNKKQFHGNVKFLLNKKITKLERRAKVLIFTLTEAGNFPRQSASSLPASLSLQRGERKSASYLAVHLKMSGQLIYAPKGTGQVISRTALSQLKSTNNTPQATNYKLKTKNLVIGGHPIRYIPDEPDKNYFEALPNKYTRIVISLTDGSKLYFNDLRKFGWFKLLNQAQCEKLLSEFGPEALTVQFKKLKSLIETGKGPTIKQSLMNQANLAGLGNIYVDEVLFCAKVSPFRRTKKVNSAEIKKIHACIKKILNLALKHQGTSETFYRTASGGVGTFGQVAKVYRREKQPCYRCQKPIIRKKLAGRSCHFCEHCQK